MVPSNTLLLIEGEKIKMFWFIDLCFLVYYFYNI